MSMPSSSPPQWDIYETIVLIAASPGTSFTLPILEEVLRSRATNYVKRIDYLLAAKHGEEIAFYVSRLHNLTRLEGSSGVELSVHVAITKGPSPPQHVEDPDRDYTKTHATDAPSASIVLGEQ